MSDIAAAFCLKGGCKTTFRKIVSRAEAEVRGIKFSFVEVNPICVECGAPVYVSDVNDENVQARENAYRKASGLITVEEIQKIIRKYNIGAGPLAQILGFGEITINRYLTGQLPSKINSEKLLEILASHKKWKKILR